MTNYLEDEGPQPEDIIISDCGRLGSKYNVGEVEGKHIGVFNDYDDAIYAIREYTAKHRFFPNVWIMSDHGNYTILDDLSL